MVALEAALPSTKARLNAPPASATAPSPIEAATLNGPVALATAPSPIAKEALNNVLVQPVPLARPKIDTQVAFAVGADPNPALANIPLVTAPATRAPAILRGEFTMLSAMIFCSIHDKNASMPLVTVPQ